MSYTKTCDNTIVQKYPLPRVLLHGQTDVDEAKDRRFFVEVVNKSVHDGMSNHNEAFLNTFHNTMKEVFHGFLVDQIGQLITTFHNHQLKGLLKPALAIKKQHQVVQGSSEQVQGATTNQIQYNPRSSVQHVQQPTGQD